ncbi:extracellular solute-binding protein [Paenibacillus sp. YN15]|uniref:extracellular solute-binding protein n=1 Tax=Paenibacillus sp. YN15 TaxID=1742774 RepID=UPI000DCC879C|nr:extracellular solute-binding protein [Paenibacillus sp. YN15]RAU98909.1 ABC transporter substrate-binding protein [Paenibacillus sp. YN15]
MKGNRWMAVAMAGVFLLTACNSGNNTQSASPSPNSSSGAAAAPTNAAKPVLKALLAYLQEDYNTYPVAKLLEEKTGYKVQYEALPADAPQDKLNLLMASGEAYDFINLPGTPIFSALYADYASKGALTDLTDLIEQYGPNIKASISEESFGAMKVNGKIYAIPTKAIESVGAGLLIRKDWLDKVGMKLPSTADEFKAMLKAFKDQDPGGNKDKNVPFSITGNNPFIDGVAGAFGLSNTWNEVDGKLVPRLLDPSYSSYIDYMKGLFDEGLLDKEFAVNKDATIKEKFTSGRAGVIPAYWSDIPGIADALSKNFPNAQYSIVPILTGPDGQAGTRIIKSMNYTVVPKTSAHPKETVQYLNAKLEKNLFREMTIGVEGVHYTYEGGAYKPILPIFNDERNRANQFLTGIDEVNYPIYWQARVRKDERLFAAFQLLQNIPEKAKIQDWLGVAPYMPQYAKTSQSLDTMTNDYTVKFIFGSEPISNLPAAQTKMNQAGATAAVQEVEKWYSSFKKPN